jgi:hypothetical protein
VTLTPAHVTAALAHERERIAHFRARVAVAPHVFISHLRRHVLALAALEVCRDHGAEQLVINRAQAALEAMREQAQQQREGDLVGAVAGAAPGGADPGGAGPRG